MSQKLQAIFFSCLFTALFAPNAFAQTTSGLRHGNRPDGGTLIRQLPAVHRTVNQQPSHFPQQNSAQHSVAQSTLFLPPATKANAVSEVRWTPHASPLNTPSAPRFARRPRIGVVLGGGGAAGVCHVGVLKVLEEYGIPVDCIAGTSMGAVVAGLYATGMSASELEKIVNEFRWDKVLIDSPAHGMKYERRKTDDYLFPPAVELGVGDGSAQLGRGLVSGQYLTLQLRRLLASTNHIKHFDLLPIPFRTLATDIETGDIVVFRQGSLATAIRASMSIPGVFPPVRVNNRLLVDGGVRDNVPVDLAREMRADILIVVQIPTQLKKGDQLKSILDITSQSLEIMSASGDSLQERGLTENDILIQPQMNGIGALDFDRAREGIALGATAAQQHHAQLRQLATMLKSLDPSVGTETPIVLGSPFFLQVDRIQINNRSHLASDALIASRISVGPGQPFGLDQLDRDIGRIYGTGNFGNVDYEIHSNELGQQVLNINTDEDSRGDTLASLGLGLEDDFSGDSFYTASLDIVSRGWNERGGEARFFGQLGSRQQLLIDFYQPINLSQTTFLRPYLYYDSYVQPFFLNGQRIADFYSQEYSAGIEAGQTLGDHSVITTGAFTGETDVDLLTGDLSLLPVTGSRGLGGAYVEIKTDSLDSYFLPKKGFLAECRYTNFTKALGNNAASDFLVARVIAANTWGRQTFIVRGEAVADDLFSGTVLRRESATGGFLRLSGFTKNAILASRRSQISLITMRHFKKMAGGRVNLYHGLSAEVGYFEGAFNVANQRPIVAGSAFVVLDNPLGPLFAGFGINDDDTHSAFISMGQVF